jgi:hypothetical protein
MYCCLFLFFFPLSNYLWYFFQTWVKLKSLANKIIQLHLIYLQMFCHTYFGISCANYFQNFIQYPALKVSSIYRGNYWG